MSPRYSPRQLGHQRVLTVSRPSHSTDMFSKGILLLFVSLDYTCLACWLLANMGRVCRVFISSIQLCEGCMTFWFRYPGWFCLCTSLFHPRHMCIHALLFSKPLCNVFYIFNQEYLVMLFTDAHTVLFFLLDGDTDPIYVHHRNWCRKASFVPKPIDGIWDQGICRSNRIRRWRGNWIRRWRGNRIRRWWGHWLALLIENTSTK
mmetsp:Transcript_36943/g.60128  ORF Transcript_36943/g.60128 Transcript_36943/m.60128 type:complete len:204 (-) Transcript_36943:346-957(-)